MTAKTSPFTDLFIAAGSQANLARDLGVSYQAVQQWVRKGHVPLSRVTEIETRYGVSRDRLVHPKYLEALSTAQFENEV